MLAVDGQSNGQGNKATWLAAVPEQKMIYENKGIC
jgi:hypothetical protein